MQLSLSQDFVRLSANILAQKCLRENFLGDMLVKCVKGTKYDKNKTSMFS